MEHAKKMVLLPKESVDRLQSLSIHGKLNSLQTPGTVVSRLDAEMNEILNSVDNMNEREKWERYSQVLQRYLHFKGSDKHKKEEEEEEDGEERGEGKEVYGPAEQIDAHIVASVPPKYSDKASQLLRHLRNFSHVTWNADGKTFIDGVLIRKANIIDLINDAMRERKKVRPPAGYPQFATALRQAGVPREFIGNNRVAQYMDSSFATSSPKLNKSDLLEKNISKSLSGGSEYEDPVGGTSSVSLSETPVIKKRKREDPRKHTVTQWKRLSSKIKKK